MFMTPAFAQGTLFGGAGGELGMIGQLMPFILIFVIMYFLILRPQQKRAKQHQEMIKNVRRGDTVITSGGLVGKVTKVVDDDHLEIEIADDVRIRQLRQMLTDVRAKGEPVKDDPPPADRRAVSISRLISVRHALFYAVEGGGDSSYGLRRHSLRRTQFPSGQDGG